MQPPIPHKTASPESRAPKQRPLDVALRVLLRVDEGAYATLALTGELSKQPLPETERDAAALARWLRSQPLLPETLNTRALRRSRALSTGKAERYDLALAELEEAGWVRAAPSRIGGGTGRQRKDWQVNPAVAELVQ